MIKGKSKNKLTRALHEVKGVYPSNELRNNLVITQNINPITHERHIKYFYKRSRCRRTILRGHNLFRTYVGYHLIKYDLIDVKSWLGSVQEILNSERDDKSGEFTSFSPERNRLICKSLFFSAVTIYGKCFTKGNNRGISLQKNVLHEKFHEKHKRIMNYRHTLAAHSDNSEWDSGDTVLVTPPNKYIPEIDPLMRVEVNRLDYVDDINVEDKFIDLVDYLISYTEKKSQETAEKIFSDVLKGVDPRFIAKHRIFEKNRK